MSWQRRRRAFLSASAWQEGRRLGAVHVSEPVFTCQIGNQQHLPHGVEQCGWQCAPGGCRHTSHSAICSRCAGSVGKHTCPLRRSTSGSPASAATARPRYSGDSLPASPGTCLQCCSSASWHKAARRAVCKRGVCKGAGATQLRLSRAECQTTSQTSDWHHVHQNPTCAKVLQHTLGAHVAR